MASSSGHRWARHRARSPEEWRHRSFSRRSRSPARRRRHRHHSPSPYTSSRSSSSSSLSPDKSHRRRRRQGSESSRSAQSRRGRTRSGRNEEPSSSNGSVYLSSSSLVNPWASSSRRDRTEETAVESSREQSRAHGDSSRSWRDRREHRRSSAEAWVTGAAAPPDVDPEVWAALPPEAREWAVAPAVGEAVAAAATSSATQNSHPLRGLYNEGSSSASSASLISNPFAPAPSEEVRDRSDSGFSMSPPTSSWEERMEGRMRLLAQMEAAFEGAETSNSSPSSEELQGAKATDHVGYSAASETVGDKAAAASDDTADTVTLKPCMVCMDAPASSTFVHGKTGHTVCCHDCAEMLYERQGTCPVCCQEVSLVIRNYFN